MERKISRHILATLFKITLCTLGLSFTLANNLFAERNNPIIIILPPQPRPNPTIVENYLLIDDFSGIDNYTKDPFKNPYWEAATGVSINPFHTNNLGGWTSGYDDWGYTGFDEISDAAGYLKIKWGQKLRSEGKTYWYWYTNFGDIDLRNLFLTFRVKGENGKENFRIKIGRIPDVYAQNITDYITITPYWQKVYIPISSLSSGGVGSLVFLFDTSAVPAGQASSTVYIDDLTLEANPDNHPPADGFLKPTSTGPVKLRGRKLYVNNQLFYIKGICYSPTPIGQTPEYGNYTPFSRQIAERDLPLIKSIGANSIRTWNRFDLNKNAQNQRQITRELLDFGVNPNNIKVCAGFWIPQEISFCNDWAKERIKQDFRDYVRRYKYEPELLFWVIGNENNLANGYDWRWYQFANELAKLAYEEEGNTYHPVAIVEADIAEAPLLGGSIGKANLCSDDPHLNYIDIIGINVYRGKNLQKFFATYSQRTQKPLWISEFGIDAWHTNNLNQPSLGQEREQLQSDWDIKIWLEINRYRSVNIGATVMEYSDEWWKDKNGALETQDYGGLAFSEAIPDRFMNEEWWGMVKVQKNAAGSDMVSPRKIFYELYSATLGGRIKDSKGRPLADAVVMLKSKTHCFRATSDEQGLYAIPRLPTGTYALLVYKPGFALVQGKIIILKNNQTLLRDIPLSPIYRGPHLDLPVKANPVS
jgi:hypothetical protein